MKLPVPEHVMKATKIFRYHARVLIAPPWEEIFRQDRERKQDFWEAVRTYEAVASTYAELGYQLVELPRPVWNRECSWWDRCLIPCDRALVAGFGDF
jgi:predicted ATPase